MVGVTAAAAGWSPNRCTNTTHSTTAMRNVCRKTISPFIGTGAGILERWREDDTSTNVGHPSIDERTLFEGGVESWGRYNLSRDPG